MKISAGILMYRYAGEKPEFLLVHPGGPFFKNKDAGAWSIPKGELDSNEDPKSAALREFREELGTELNGEMLELSPVTQKSGKKVLAWAINGDLDPSLITCNTFTIEWPPKSGRMQDFPEIDRAAWFSAEEAIIKINPAQVALITELLSLISS